MSLALFKIVEILTCIPMKTALSIHLDKKCTISLLMFYSNKKAELFQCCLIFIFLIELKLDPCKGTGWGWTVDEFYLN